MLTSRQKEVLHLIIELYSRFEEPIGSKTLLRESLLKVSPATIRNDMMALESEGFLVKTHTSSGRVPSLRGYQYYVSGLIEKQEKRELDQDDMNSLEALLQAKSYHPLQLAQLAADILTSLTNYTALVLGQDQETHYLDEFKLVPLSNSTYLAILMTNRGKIENDIIKLQFNFSPEEIQKITRLVNEELQGISLEDAYQRMKLSIPLLTQRLVGYQIDFSFLVEKAIDNLKGHHYYVRGKSSLYDLIDAETSKETYKELIELVDGSRKMYHILESRQYPIEVLFGHEFLSENLANINLITGTYFNQNQKITLGLLGPTTMVYERIIPMMDRVVDILRNQ